MATEIRLIKLAGGTFIPMNEESAEVVKPMPCNKAIKAVLTVPVNEKFRRKWFALVKIGFEIFDETVDKQREYKGAKITTDFDRFRKDITILCGFFEAHYNALGEARLSAKSIAWHRMDDSEFEKLYQKTITVILEKVIPRAGISEQHLREWVDTVLGFAN